MRSPWPPRAAVPSPPGLARCVRTGVPVSRSTPIAALLSSFSGAQGGPQVSLPPLQKPGLVIAADLAEGNVGETGVSELLDGADHGVDGVAAGDGLGDIFGTH